MRSIAPGTYGLLVAVPKDASLLIPASASTSAIAFAPGFLTAAQRHGKPIIFIAHGREDGILPIENTTAEADSAFHWLLR